MPVTGAAMAIMTPEDAAVAALELALAEGEEGEILSDEMDTEPVTTGVKDQKLRTKWGAKSSHKLIGEAADKAPNLSCRLCGAVCTTRKHLRLHAQLHYVHTFRSCGYNSKWRETVRMYQKDSRNQCIIAGSVHEVDSMSFDRWRRTVGVNQETYPGEVPTRVVTFMVKLDTKLTKKSTTSAPSSLTDNSCAQAKRQPQTLACTCKYSAFSF